MGYIIGGIIIIILFGISIISGGEELGCLPVVALIVFGVIIWYGTKTEPSNVPIYNRIKYQYNYSNDYVDEDNNKLTISYERETKSFVVSLVSSSNIEVFNEVIFIEEKDYFYKTLDGDIYLKLNGNKGDVITIISGEDKIIFYKQKL